MSATPRSLLHLLLFYLALPYRHVLGNLLYSKSHGWDDVRNGLEEWFRKDVHEADL